MFSNVHDFKLFSLLRAERTYTRDALLSSHVFVNHEENIQSEGNVAQWVARLAHNW